MKSYVSLETKNTKMEYDQELLERRKMLKGEIETLERKLRDIKKELLQVEEELRSDGNIMDYEKNIRDNADGYESDRNSSEEKCETRKRKEIYLFLNKQQELKYIRKYKRLESCQKKIIQDYER